MSPAPWCLKAGVDNLCTKDISATINETTINGNPEVFIKNILDNNYDVISFTCYIWNIKNTLYICKKIKEKSNPVIILGGPEVSYIPKTILDNNNYIDYILSGEGERTYPLLLNTLNAKGDLSSVPGLSYRMNSKIITIPEEKYTETPPSPYTDEFFKALNGRIAYIETSRGCPYRCAFCLSGRCSDLRFFNIEQVKKDIIELSKGGSKTIKFVDRTFNADKKRTKALLSFILDNYGKEIPDDVCFHFEISGDILDEETLNLLKNAPIGAFQLEIGIQSFNEKTLSAINRKTNTEKLCENIKKLISFNNMHIHIDLIAGLTYEDINSFEKGFNKAYKLNAHMLQMGFLKLLHGAEMRENKEKYPCEFTDEPPYQVTSTPWLTNDEIICLKNCEDALDRLYNSGRFIMTLDYIINQCNNTPFKVFYNFGNMIKGCKMPLSDYALHLYDYFKSYEGINKDVLRECILCDLLCCSSALQIPNEFKIKDTLYKQIKKHFCENKTDMIKIAIRYTKNTVFVVNQSGKKDFKNRFPSKEYPLSDLNT